MVRGCAFVFLALIVLGGIVAAFKPKGEVQSPVHRQQKAAEAKAQPSQQQPDVQPIVNVARIIWKDAASVDAVLGVPADILKGTPDDPDEFRVYRPRGRAGIEFSVRFQGKRAGAISVMPPERGVLEGDPLALLALKDAGFQLSASRPPIDTFKGQLAGVGPVTVRATYQTQKKDGQYSQLTVAARP